MQFTLRKMFSIITLICIGLAIFTPRLKVLPLGDFCWNIWVFIANPTLWWFGRETLSMSPSNAGMAALVMVIGGFLTIALHYMLIGFILIGCYNIYCWGFDKEAI